MLNRIVLAAAALTATLGGFAATTTTAHAAPAGYSATLATPLPAPRDDVLGETLWACAGDRCGAGQETSRPLIACQRVAHRFGPVTQFTARGAALSPADLARCNGDRAGVQTALSRAQ